MLVIGNLIKLRRVELSLKQSDVARLTGLSDKTISDIENMDSMLKSPSIRNVEKVLDVLGLAIDIHVASAPTLDDLLKSRSEEHQSPPAFIGRARVTKKDQLK